MGEDSGVRNVCQGTEYRKEYGCSGNVERFPLTEDHNSEGKESGTGYADFEIPGGNGRNDVCKSADTAECTGDDNTGVSPLVYVDTNRVGQRRLLLRARTLLLSLHRLKGRSR